jgi:hypothetical protein
MKYVENKAPNHALLMRDRAAVTKVTLMTKVAIPIGLTRQSELSHI